MSTGSWGAAQSCWHVPPCLLLANAVTVGVLGARQLSQLLHSCLCLPGRGCWWVGAGGPCAAPLPAGQVRRGPAVRCRVPAGSSWPCGKWWRRTWHSQATSGCCSTSKAGWAAAGEQPWGQLGMCSCLGVPLLHAHLLWGHPCCPPQATPSRQDSEQETLREQQQPALSPAAQLTCGPTRGEPCSHCTVGLALGQQRGAQGAGCCPSPRGTGHLAQPSPCQHPGTHMSHWNWGCRHPLGYSPPPRVLNTLSPAAIAPHPVTQPPCCSQGTHSR